MSKKTPREPRFSLIVKYSSAKKALLIRAVAIVCALIVNAIFGLVVAKINPVSFYATIFKGAFGNKLYTSETIAYAAKLLLISVALAPAFKMKFWNIGAEGQVVIGALTTAIIMVTFGSKVSAPVLFIMMFLSAIVIGAVWGLIPAVCKAKFGTNETLFTLMMNYVAARIADYYYNVWKGPASSLGKLNKATRAGWFPAIFGQRYTISVIIIVLVAVVMYFYMYKTKHGYEISVTGESVNTARYAGINVTKVTIRTMIISGALCGLCGALTVAGQDQTVSSNTAGGYGFTAIIVAWLSHFNPLTMIIVSVLIVAMEKGTKLLSNNYDNFSDSASSIVVGIVLFFVIGSEFFIRYKLVRNKKKKEA